MFFLCVYVALDIGSFLFHLIFFSISRVPLNPMKIKRLFQNPRPSILIFPNRSRCEAGVYSCSCFVIERELYAKKQWTSNRIRLIGDGPLDWSV